MPVAWKTGWMKPGAKGDAEIKMSSGEAEVSGAAEGLKLAKHIQYMCQEMGISVPDRISLGVDATVAISFASGTQVKSRMKHINLKWAWVKELKDEDVSELVKVPGKDNLADVMTKVLPGPEFAKADRKLR